MPTYHASSLDAFRATVVEITQSLKPPTVILLHGDLGAGKTKFVECFVNSQGGSNVSSPTFTFHQQYSIGKEVVHHFDLYRAETDAEIETTGLWDVLARQKGFVCIEWPQRIPQNFPGWNVISVQIQIGEHQERILSC